MELPRPQRPAGRASSTPRTSARSASPTRTSRSAATTRSPATSTGSTSSTSEPGRADAEDVRRLPGRPGRHVRLRRPALHVGRGDPRAKIDCGATPPRPRRPASAASASSTSATSPRRCRSRPCRRAAARTRTRSSPTRTTRPTSTSTSRARPASAPAPSSPAATATARTADPTTANFRIDVIKVPLAAPQTAAVVSDPRLFSKCGSSACESQFATQEQHPDPRYGVRGTSTG